MKKALFVIISALFCLNFVIGENYINHEVKDGETLWRITKDYKITFDDLCRINHINDITKIKKGVILKIPAAKTGSTLKVNSKKETGKTDNGEYKIHILKNNETLWSISHKYKIPVKELCELNNIDDISKVNINARIKIPLHVECLDFNLPFRNGEIIESNSAHFKGIYIFTDKKDEFIRAIDDGEVSYTDNITGYGITVFVRQKNGYVIMYAGYKEIYVKTGDKIAKDQITGIAGSISRYNKIGILMSIQCNGNTLLFNKTRQKFIKPVNS